MRAPSLRRASSTAAACREAPRAARGLRRSRPAKRSAARPMRLGEGVSTAVRLPAARWDGPSSARAARVNARRRGRRRVHSAALPQSGWARIAKLGSGWHGLTRRSSPVAAGEATAEKNWMRVSRSEERRSASGPVGWLATSISSPTATRERRREMGVRLRQRGPPVPLRCGLEHGGRSPAALRVSFCGVELARQRTSESSGQRMQTASEEAMCGRAAVGACTRGCECAVEVRRGSARVGRPRVIGTTRVRVHAQATVARTACCVQGGCYCCTRRLPLVRARACGRGRT